VIRVDAHAKLNLYLHVVGRRDDGYHLIDSLAAFAALHDTLTAAPADTLTLAVDGPFAAALATESDNLVLRAARALAAAHGREPRARLQLTKRIPVAAGLGGGSADAAAALHALARLWNVDIPSALPLRLGADVPVCLVGRPASMSGIGEHLTPAPALPEVALLLVNPGIGVATRDVFDRRSGGYSPPSPIAETAGDAAGLARLLGSRRNDLTEAAASIAPPIRAALSAVAATEGCLLARMSGSGATVFGLYASDAAAAGAAALVGEAQPSWWVWAGPLQPR
jgi:4-diphosphocytidyl-2-C-methyl-D-erythritol kinase